jgi:hypothetical protein
MGWVVKAAGEQTMALSTAQQNLLDRMKAGARLAWSSDRGRYQLTDGRTIRSVNPRTVDQLVRAKQIERDLMGGCSVAQGI